MRQATSDPQHAIPSNTRRLTDLDFADDLALLGETAKSLQAMTDNLASTAVKVGLKFSTEKTKLMSVREQQPMALMVNQQETEEVENFTYLRSSISNKCATERDISCQLDKAASVFQRLSSISPHLCEEQTELVQLSCHTSGYLRERDMEDLTTNLHTSLMYSITNVYGRYSKYRGKIMLQMMMSVKD